ncbi:hypothetical protein V6N11_071182 [Hibiscus sabdariffa]|uniref:Uncharacterized protein n=1 Tax=Hibiscus sabdariffa TaxID=183260 RepID=A0ABR2TZL8_9ROSI
MYNPDVVQTSLRVDGFEVVVCPWHGLLVVIRVSSLLERQRLWETRRELLNLWFDELEILDGFEGGINVELSESPDKPLEHVAINSAGPSSLSNSNLHEVQVFFDTNLVIDVHTTRFAIEDMGNRLSISHASRLQEVEVGLLDVGCEVSSTALRHKGETLSKPRPGEPNPECGEAGQTSGIRMNKQTKASKRGKGIKRGLRDSSGSEGIHLNSLDFESTSLHTFVPLEGLDEAQATLLMGEELGVEFQAPRSVVLEHLVAVDLE